MVVASDCKRDGNGYDSDVIYKEVDEVRMKRKRYAEVVVLGTISIQLRIKCKAII